MRYHFLIICTSLLVLAQQGQSTFGAYTSKSAAKYTYQCLKEQDIEFLIFEIGDMAGNIYSDINQVLLTASQYIPTIDVFFYLNSTLNAQDYVNKIKSTVSPSLYQNIFMMVAYTSSSDYDYQCTYTQDFYNKLVQALPNNIVGFLSTSSYWYSRFGSYTACTKFTNQRLMYMSRDNYPSFSDWPERQFGGWTNPYAKFLDDVLQLCGNYVMMAYRA